MLSLTRLAFYFANHAAFQDVSILDFIIGVWVDCIAIGIWFIPFYVLSLLPHPFRYKKFYTFFLKCLFHLTNGILIALNLLDVEYFKYTSKRSTADLFSIVSAGNDIYQLFTTFIADFWWLILFFILLLILSNYLYNKTKSLDGIYQKSMRFWSKDIITFVLFGAMLFIMGRGGLSIRPADMLTVATYTQPDKLTLTLNTPLTIIKTIGKIGLKTKNYFEDERKLSQLFNPIREPNKQVALSSTPNVFVVILESFGNEWLGKKTGGKFTPFLDSLIDQSLYFSNAYANGKKSIEAMPAIFAGIPTLMDNPYISSPYGMNRIKAMPTLLKEKGYSSGFFHGATNGSMKFDEFANVAGFDHYFGRMEYNNEAHCDDTWGVLDEYFNPWSAKTVTKTLNEPFLAGLFTLSSHHPYFIPEEHINDLPEGEFPIAKSIAYGDMSLRKFFVTAKQQPWFDNTIFIICADHTPAGNAPFYFHSIGMYQIPILIFDPSGRLEKGVNNKIVSHIDIMPTILDLLAYDEQYYSFGQSIFSQNKTRFAYNYINETYHLFKDDYLLKYQNDEPVGFYNYKLDSLAQSDSTEYYPAKVENQVNIIRAIIQRFNNDMIKNQLTVE
jgi:phosphoglycerol transferase MdoB-like AlkP superfamily enzyme